MPRSLLSIFETEKLVQLESVMAMSSQGESTQLLDSFNEFDIIDSNFDPAFTELTGVASADYIPMEEGEVFMMKGERVCMQSET